MVDNNHILVDGDGTVIYLSDTDTSDIFIVIDGADQYLGRSFRVSFRCGNVIRIVSNRGFISFISSEISSAATPFLAEAYTNGQSNCSSEAPRSMSSSRTSLSDAGLCKSECCRFFKKYMRMTIFDYLLSTRIQNSLPLLMNGENITTIAGLVGFSSPAYYGQIFKRYMGMSPSQYKKHAAQSSSAD